MISKIILVLCLNEVLALRTYVVQTNTDYVGFDIIYYDFPFQYCPQTCDNLQGCVAYVTHKDNGRGCWFKNVIQKYAVANSNRDMYVAIKQRSDIQGIVVNRTGKNFPGNDLFYWQGDINTCLSVCDATLSCIGFAMDQDFFGNLYNCWMKSSFSNVQFDLFKGGVNILRTVYTPKRLYTKQAQTDYRGNDIGGYGSTNVDYCSRLCDETANCVGFSLTTYFGACYLKSSMVGGGSSDTGVDSYFKQRYTIEANIDYPGNGIGNYGYFSGSIAECTWLCDTTNLCTGFVLDGNGCWLIGSFNNRITSSKSTYRKPT